MRLLRDSRRFVLVDIDGDKQLICSPVRPHQFAFLPIVIPTGIRAGQTFPAWAIETRNGQGSVTVSLQSGSLAPGMSLQADGSVGLVTLPANARGTYNAVVAATDDSQTITTTVQIVIDYGLLTVTMSSAPPSAVDGAAYSLLGVGYITLSGGDGVYGLTRRASTYLPGNLSLGMVGGDDAVWDVSGTCNGVSGQTYTAILDATSADGQTFAFTLVIPVQAVAPVPFDIALASLPNFTVGASYSTKNLTVTGAIGTLTITRSGGAPAGWTASTSQSGAGPTFPMFGGTATDGYGLSYSGTITASDAGTTPPRTKTIPYSVTGNPAAAPTATITMPTFTNAVPGSSYSKTATVSGGSGHVWTLTGLLPPGFTFSGGVWTATTVGNSGAGQSYSGTVTATPASGTADTKSWAITVDPLSTAFVAPYLATSLPSISAEANVSESNTYNVSDYVNYGSLTEADVIVDIETTSILLPGMSLSMGGGGTTFTLAYDATTGGNPATNTAVPYRLTLSYTDPETAPVEGAEAAYQRLSAGADFATNFSALADVTDGLDSGYTLGLMDWDRVHFLTGGGSLRQGIGATPRVRTTAGATSYNSASWQLRFPTLKVLNPGDEVWTQIVFRPDEFWLKHRFPYSGAQTGQKIIQHSNYEANFTQGSSNHGCTINNDLQHGFIAGYVGTGTQAWTSSGGAISVRPTIADSYRHHNAIDNDPGSPPLTNPGTGGSTAAKNAYIARYGGVENLIGNSTVGVGDDMRTNVPDPRVDTRVPGQGSIGLSFTDWEVITIRHVCGSNPAGATGIVQVWQNRIGEQPILMISRSDVNFNLSGSYGINGLQLPGYISNVTATDGRTLDAFQYYDWLIVSDSEIKAPNLTGTADYSMPGKL